MTTEKYIKLKQWLSENYRDIHNEWREEEIKLDNAQAKLRAEQEEERLQRARDDWQSKNDLMREYLDSDSSKDLNPDIRQVIEMQLSAVFKETKDGKIIEPAHIWDSIRTLMRGQRHSPIRR